jgi:uncharacterized membrane protein YfcA
LFARSEVWSASDGGDNVLLIQAWEETAITALSVLLTLAVLFVASLTHAAFGFGTASIAMPLLVIILGLQPATALVGLVMLTTIAVLLSTEWRGLDVRAAWQLLLSSAVGIPVGVLVVRLAPEMILKVTLGILLVSVSLYSLTRPALPRLQRARWVYGFGFVAGVLGGAYNANAPPVVVYGVMQHWTPERFRATLQGYFLPAALLICTGHALSGFWTGTVARLYLLTLPGTLVAVWVGRKLGRCIPLEKFQRALYGALVALGGLLLL